MKKILLSVSLIIGFTAAAVASNLSFSGVSPVYGAYEWGVGGGIVSSATAGTLDFNTLEFEVFYRKYVEESLDWGFSLSPIAFSDLLGSLDFIFDLKCRLLKESSVIPNIVLGVNMVRTHINTTSDGVNISFSFLDSGRIGFSKTFETYMYYQDAKKKEVAPIKRTEFYIGTYILNQAIDYTKIYFGFKKGSLNFMVESGEDGITFIGISFLVTD
jgi:hypothetical protein